MSLNLKNYSSLIIRYYHLPFSIMNNIDLTTDTPNTISSRKLIIADSKINKEEDKDNKTTVKRKKTLLSCLKNKRMDLILLDSLETHLMVSNLMDMQQLVVNILNSSNKTSLPLGKFDVDQELNDINICSKIKEAFISTSKPNEGLNQIRVYKEYDLPREEGIIKNDNGKSTVWTKYTLPSFEFRGVWDTLHFGDSNIKRDLICNMRASMFLSETGLDSNNITWNRLCLLYGPPGTGKTTLCKAMAQEIAITCQCKYSKTYLLEINTHSLFSKYFSESGKQVVELFNGIISILADQTILVIILLDEIESVSAARKMALSRNEPSDAVRVVNSLLTQLDKLKRYTNCQVLTTSNITEMLDEAFLDRSDFICYVPHPNKSARKKILLDILNELLAKDVLQKSEDCSNDLIFSSDKTPYEQKNLSNQATLLDDAIAATEGQSGRQLRKLPFKILVKLGLGYTVKKCYLEKFLQCLIEESYLQRKEKLENLN